MIEAKTFAESTLQLLQAKPENYRNFGSHWYFVKALMKRFYTKDNLYLLGGYQDETVINRMPQHAALQDALEAAVEEYQHNATFGMGTNVLVDAEGEQFTLIDEDAGL